MGYRIYGLKMSVTPFYVGLHGIMLMDITRRLIAERRKGHRSPSDKAPRTLTTSAKNVKEENIRKLEYLEHNFVTYVPLSLMSIGFLEAYYDIVPKYVIHTMGASLFLGRAIYYYVNLWDAKGWWMTEQPRLYAMMLSCLPLTCCSAYFITDEVLLQIKKLNALSK
jgi:uncharacterized membrane protein YecN with MAPEG domain